MNVQRDLFTGEVIQATNRKKPLTKKVNGVKLHGCDLAVEAVQVLTNRITLLERTVDELREIICQENRPAKESYSTREVASIMGRKPYTVREWCRLKRINAEKAMCGRGCEKEWRISHSELLRIQNEGQLPPPERY